MKKVLRSLGILFIGLSTTFSFANSQNDVGKLKNQLLYITNLIIKTDKSKEMMVKAIIHDCAESHKNTIIQNACKLVTKEREIKRETSTPSPKIQQTFDDSKVIYELHETYEENGEIKERIYEVYKIYEENGEKKERIYEVYKENGETKRRYKDSIVYKDAIRYEGWYVYRDIIGIKKGSIGINMWGQDGYTVTLVYIENGEVKKTSEPIFWYDMWYTNRNFYNCLEEHCPLIKTIDSCHYDKSTGNYDDCIKKAFKYVFDLLKGYETNDYFTDKLEYFRKSL